MALLTWRVRDAKGIQQGPTWYLDFEATLLEEYTRAANVTEYPVENGAVLTDHYQPQPRAIALDVMVSNTPAQPYRNVDNAQNSAQPQSLGVERPLNLDLPVDRTPVLGLAGQRIIQSNIDRTPGPRKRTASVLQFDGRVNRVVDVFTVLDGLIQTRQIVDVRLFGDREFKDMLIVNVQAPRTADIGDAIRFSIDLVQVTFADTEAGQITDKAPTESKFKAKQKKGNKNAKPVTRGTRAASNAIEQPWYSSTTTPIPAG